MIGIIEVGSRVRVALHGRRVGGWVVELLDRSSEVASEALKPILKSSGLGPSPDVIDLARWASQRWCASRLRPFLVVASPPVVVHRPATPRRTRVVAEPTSPATSGLIERGGGVLRLPPTVDHLPTILSAARVGPTLVVCPAVDQARVLSHRLRRTGVSVALVPEDWAQARGGVDVVIGARGAAFAPCPDLRVAVVLDEHDEGLQEERTPTWHARDVIVERCRRVGAVPVLVSPVPSVEAWSSLGARGDSVVAPDRDRERRAWPEVELVDLSEQEPWKRSLVSTRLVADLRDESRRVVCVVNTKGQARASACRSCRTLARCVHCEAAVVEIERDEFVCPRCDSRRPRVCAACGSTTMARVRPGTTRLREELERASLRQVLEVTASSGDVDDTGADVFVGTEAVLHRVRRADTVVFLDVDSELLAPRFRSREQMWSLVARAARLVGSSGRVVLQTSLADHDTVRAMVDLDLDRAVRDEWERRRTLDLPPFSTVAVVEGDGLAQWATDLSSVSGVEVTDLGERLLVRAVDWRRLADAWESARSRLEKDARTRRVRIAVDPPRV
ncbi:MAG: putative primosomal protein n [Actinomycetota bacterium]